MCHSSSSQANPVLIPTPVFALRPHSVPSLTHSGNPQRESRSRPSSSGGADQKVRRGWEEKLELPRGQIHDTKLNNT